MSISSHQHRNLRRLIISAFVFIVVISLSIWLVVNKKIHDSAFDIVNKNNQLVVMAIGDVIQATDKDGVNVLSKLSFHEAIKSSHYSNLLVVAKKYLNKFNLVKISLISQSGKIIFSTKSEDIGQGYQDKNTIQRVLQGEVLNSRHESQFDKRFAHLPENQFVSFASLLDAKGNAHAVVEIITATDIHKNLDYLEYFMLTGMIVGIIILLAILFSIAKYSDNLVNKYAKQIVTQSKSDPVTGLLNRHYFFRFVRQSVARTLQQNGRSALLMIDIDHFKELNAKYDHTFGDEVLKILVQRLVRMIGASDTLARTGDDEFSILIEQLDSNATVQDIAQKVLDKINEPIQIDATYIHLTCSIGISVINQDAKDIDELVHHADSALYNAKDFGRNNFQMFSRGGAMRHIKFYDKQFALNKALEENEFLLHIQPKISSESGKLVGGEALLRWDNPDYGLVPPLEFLPALETSGLIHNVGKWVLQEVCKVCKHLKQHNILNVPISLNVSAIQFKKESFVSDISTVLRENDLDGSMLELELTETSLMDNVEYSLHILTRLKDMGIRIAIDDFGTGYSSLHYLKKFPIDVLKIDRSFIKDINERGQKENAAIVTAIMALSHSLHIDAVAKGVETAQELQYLSALGCKTIQGFLFSKPIEIEEFEEMVIHSDEILKKFEDVRHQLA